MGDLSSNLCKNMYYNIIPNPSCLAQVVERLPFQTCIRHRGGPKFQSGIVYYIEIKM